MPDLHRKLRPVLAAGILLSLWVTGASAACVGVGTVTADGLRLRAEANTTSSVLAKANTGACAVVLEEAKNGWYKVSYGAQEGYMSADYLKLETRADADLGYGKVDTGGSVLNLRGGPGTSHNKVGALQDGTVVKLTGMDSGWYKIEYQDSQGYVSSDYISICPKEEAPKAQAAAAVTKDAQTLPADGTWGSGVSTQPGLDLVEYGKQFLGVPYVYGGNGPDKFDCSGFTKYVYSHFGYKINRTASSQLKNGTAVAADQLQAGDLVFFNENNPSVAATHVGIYIADGQFIHATTNHNMVEIDTLYSAYNSKYYIGARRVLG